MKYHLATVAVLLASVACYLLGLRIGFGLLVVLGLFLEGVVWMRSGRRSKATNS
jgi:hypothetical protein